MTTENITVLYKWTAKPSQFDTLKGIYANVSKAMDENEPGATAVHVYASKDDNAIYVRDEFANADALGFHLSETAAAHFPSLLEIATPGAFQFFGDVPAPMRDAIRQMGLAAEFGEHVAGFDR